jgi:hypothetical protein
MRRKEERVGREGEEEDEPGRPGEEGGGNSRQEGRWKNMLLQTVQKNVYTSILY